MSKLKHKRKNLNLLFRRLKKKAFIIKWFRDNDITFERFK